MIYYQLSVHDFCDLLFSTGYSDQFSYPARVALFEYLDSIDAPVEFDAARLCSEWTEMSGDPSPDEPGTIIRFKNGYITNWDFNDD